LPGYTGSAGFRSPGPETKKPSPNQESLFSEAFGAPTAKVTTNRPHGTNTKNPRPFHKAGIFHWQRL
jgi:hypothetical protein